MDLAEILLGNVLHQIPQIVKTDYLGHIDKETMKLIMEHGHKMVPERDMIKLLYKLVS